MTNRPTARPPRGADQVEGRVLQVDRDGLLVDWGGRLGQLHRGRAEVGVRTGGVAQRGRVRARGIGPALGG